MREYHVRFCERFGVKLPLPTRLIYDFLIGDLRQVVLILKYLIVLPQSKWPCHEIGSERFRTFSVEEIFLFINIKVIRKE